MRWLAITVAILLLIWWVAASAASLRSPQPAFLYSIARQYEPEAWRHGGDRFPQGAQIFVRDRNGEHALLPDFAESGDPVVSFDGQRVLFAGKRRPGDSWGIWELRLGDKSLRRVVACAENCVRPLYLPEDRVVYARQSHAGFVIEATTPGSASSLPLTYAPGNALPLDVLHDGRVLFEAGYPLGGGAITELYTVYSDGSGVEAYRCDHGRSRRSGRQLASGDIVLSSGGGLVRFTSSLAHEVEINSPGGEYAGEIAELPDGAWLLPWRANSGQPYELVLWKPGSSKLDPVLRRGEANLVQPALLAPRPVPNRHPSALHDWNYANLLCLNAYTSRYKITDAALARVRLYTQDASGQPKVLGEAPVEQDGSFYARTPADQPLQIELVDHSGRTVKKEEGWFWLRRGEQRICVGCHAGPETAPENAVPLVLLRSTIPADLTGNAPPAARGGR